MKQLRLSLRVYLAWLKVIRKGDKSNEINLNHELLAFGERGKPVRGTDLPFSHKNMFQLRTSRIFAEYFSKTLIRR